MKPVIIDTDPGIDDVMALTAALYSEELDVQLITTVGGNVGIETTTKNTIDLVTFLEKDTPIAKGASGPLLGDPHTASEVHGESGIGGYQFKVEGNKALLTDENAILALRDQIKESPEPVTLVAIGPLTNIALLLKTFPEVQSNIEQIVIMGGAVEGGNVTPVAEFNIFADPHAAQIVFESGVSIVMCGLDATSYTNVTLENLEKVRARGDIGEMAYDMLYHLNSVEEFPRGGIVIHDMCTILYLTEPDLFTTKQADIEVATSGPATGCTVVRFKDHGHISVCLTADTEGFRKEFLNVFNDAY